MSRNPEPSRQQIVLELFTQALSQPAEMDSDFFSLGGDSLQANRLISSLQSQFGVRLPNDAIFRWSTPRHLAAALTSTDDVGTATAGAVALNRHTDGLPVFMVPGAVPTPWEYQPLVEALDLRRPVYGLRCPDLDWPRDVMTLPEMVAHYAATIRYRQPRGPYTLVGYSWGGLIAVDIAQRLATEGGDAPHVVLLDTYAPDGPVSRYVPPSWLWRKLSLSFLARHGLLSFTAAEGVRSSLSARVLFAFGVKPLTIDELRRVYRLVISDTRQHTHSLSFDQLCAAIVERMRSSVTADQWNDRLYMRHLPDDDPNGAVKFWKVMVKNRLILRRYRPATLFPGRMTIYACAGNKAVLRWQRYANRPPDVVWTPASARRGTTGHNLFLDRENIALYSTHLRTLLTSGERVE